MVLAILFLLWGAVLLWTVVSPHKAQQVDGAVTVEEAEKLVALTFDDGPRLTTTSPLLDGLAERGVHATFFLVGLQIEKYPQVVTRIAREGHEIGIHTYDHVQVTGLSEQEFRQQLDRCRTLVRDLTGQEEFFFRPPYGLTNENICSWAECPIILWSVDPEDWKDKTVSRIVSCVLDQVKDGDIILMHDIYPTSVEAALWIADALSDRGFCFVTVEQLMALRGVTPQAGALYFSLPPED